MQTLLIFLVVSVSILMIWAVLEYIIKPFQLQKTLRKSQRVPDQSPTVDASEVYSRILRAVKRCSNIEYIDGIKWMIMGFEEVYKNQTPMIKEMMEDLWDAHDLKRAELQSRQIKTDGVPILVL